MNADTVLRLLLLLLLGPSFIICVKPTGDLASFFLPVEDLFHKDHFAPTLQRQTRSAERKRQAVGGLGALGTLGLLGGGGGPGDGALLPLLLTLQQQKQAKADPPPPPPGSSATPAANPLTALLPFLLLSGVGGGLGGPLGGGTGFFGGGSSFGGDSYDSYEGGIFSGDGGGGGGLNAILPFLALSTAANAPAAALIAKPGSIKSSRLQLPETNVTGNERVIVRAPKRYPSAGTSASVASSPAATPAIPVSIPAKNLDCEIRQPRSTVCDDLPLDKILALRNSVVVMKGRKLYRIRPNGEPFDMHPTMLDEKIALMTATATIDKAQYIFQGDKVTKYDVDFKPVSGTYPKKVSEEFPGVITPVDGVFQLNNHTFVFASGAKFVYYQPAANPKVDPRYSPQHLDDVPGVPDTIDSAFTIKNRKFLHRQGTIYEMAPGEMRAIGEIPVFSSVVEGWLQCPDIFPPNCVQQQRETTRKPRRTTESKSGVLPLP